MQDYEDGIIEGPQHFSPLDIDNNNNNAGRLEVGGLLISGFASGICTGTSVQMQPWRKISNHAFIAAFWIWTAFCGWIIALGGLSRMQNVVNSDSGSGTASWSIRANYPDLEQEHVFRFDWFTLFLELVILAIVVLVILSDALKQARLSIVGLLAVATVLQIISADRFYDVSDFRNFAPARTTFAGYIICAIADFSLIYMLGLKVPEQQ